MSFECGKCGTEFASPKGLSKHKHYRHKWDIALDLTARFHLHPTARDVLSELEAGRPAFPLVTRVRRELLFRKHTLASMRLHGLIETGPNGLPAITDRGREALRGSA